MVCSEAMSPLSDNMEPPYSKTRLYRQFSYAEFAVLAAAAGDGGDEHDLVAVLEGVGFAAEETDVLVVDVDVDEAAELAVFAFDLGGERGEGLVDIGEQARKILGS